MYTNENHDALKTEILNKLGQLLNKQEYYEYQERVYRTNKALSSIVRAKDIQVSSFLDTPKEATSESENLTAFNLRDILETIESLLKEKQENNSIMSYLTTSSSEEDAMEVDTTCPEKARKHLIRNLWNLELTLRTQMMEKNLAYIDKLDYDSRRIYDAHSSTTMNTSTFSSPCKNQNAFKSAITATPLMKKNFFEDKENVGFRRHSMGEKKILTLESSFSNQKRRRSEDVKLVSGIKKFYPIEEENDDDIVSNFTISLHGINEEDIKSDQSE
jgi:hypothetical protein